MKTLFVKIRTFVPDFIKNFIKTTVRSSLVAILQKRYNLIHRAQFEAERKFFKCPPEKIEKILGDEKIGVLDVGARGGVEDGLIKYRQFLSIAW